jgi:hypothetical protein
MISWPPFQTHFITSPLYSDRDQGQSFATASACVWERFLFRTGGKYSIVTSVQKIPIRYVRIAFFALAAIGSASFKALKDISRAYRLLPSES